MPGQTQVIKLALETLENFKIDSHQALRFNLEANAQVRFNLVRHEVQHCWRQRRLYPDPESVVHNVVRILKVAADSVVSPNHVWLASEVSCKKQASSHLVLV